MSRRDVLNLSSAWASPGVYVLLGALGTESTTELYVGKAVKVRDRLNHHRTKPKLPWWRAVAVTRDTTAGFNSAEIGYLEGRLYSELSALPSIVWSCLSSSAWSICVTGTVKDARVTDRTPQPRGG